MSESKNSSSSLSRRSFLQHSGTFVFFIGASGVLPSLSGCSEVNAMDVAIQQSEVNAWVKLASDGMVTICNPAAEMGQGSMTSLPVLFAEEMDARWEDVLVEFSPQEPAVYGSEGWGNRKIMLTAGSRTTPGYFNVMRRAGAQARHILMNSAAKHWNVPMDELTTEPGKVVHRRSSRKIGYGDLIDFMEIPENLPDFEQGGLKDSSEYRLIGKDMPRTDIHDKITGEAKFAIDIQLTDMVYAVIERGRVHGAKPTLNNGSFIRQFPGVVEVIELNHGIGILAETLEQALNAKKQLDISWSDSAATGFNSEEAFDEYERVASGNETGGVITDKGDFRKARSNASNVYASDFKNDYVYHAQMEPLNSIVRVSSDGQHAEIWAGSQQGFTPKFGVPNVLGIPAENVKMHMQYLGGGFGRRSMTDFITECAFLAKEVAPRPVKLIWTREDDLTYGAYRPMSLQRLEVTTDSNGKLTGLSHIVVGDGDNLVASGIRNEYYDIPNQHAEFRVLKHGVRLKHWRAVGHGPNKFAIECMIDEVAFQKGEDPVAFRRSLMQKHPRALATLDRAAEISKWSEGTPPGHARGVAFLERSGTLSTGICEISLDKRTGKIKVHHFWTAIDAGIVVQPENVKAQMEGGIIMGMSTVFSERLTVNNGAVQQSNFHDYPILRIEDIPESISTAIIPSQEHPAGVGESGTPLVAGAVANAFLALTGKRLRHLPFTPERVLEVLNS